MNRIKEVLKNKGIEEVKPTKELLERLQIHLHSWNKWVENKKDPAIWQLEIIADFMNCTVTELIESKNERAGV